MSNSAGNFRYIHVQVAIAVLLRWHDTVDSSRFDFSTYGIAKERKLVRLFDSFFHTTAFRLTTVNIRLNSTFSTLRFAKLIHTHHNALRTNPQNSSNTPLQ